MVEVHGLKRWPQVAAALPCRGSKQCCERYKHHLSPDIVKDSWTRQEDLAIVTGQSVIGNKWAEIAQILPGRTSNAVKNRWNWMISPRREDVLDTLVKQNVRLFKQILVETAEGDHDDSSSLQSPTSLRHAQILQHLFGPDVEQVERPFASRNSCGGLGPLCFDRAGPLVRSSERWTCSWARLFTQRLWTFGYQEQALASIFDALPESFCAAIQTAADRLQGHMLAAHSKLIANGCAAVRDAASSVAAGPEMVMMDAEDGQLCPREDGAPAFLECLEDIWERDGAEGYIEFAFDPATQQRVNVQLNSRTAAIAGMHKEEVLARLAAHDAPISFLPLDYLCALLHQSLRAAVPSSKDAGEAGRTHTDVMHLRMTRTGSEWGGSSLIRMEAVKVFNARGQVTQVRYLTRIVTPEDYDTAVRLRPETCPMHYMGDRRTGQQLLSEADADAAITVSALARRLSTAGIGCEGTCYDGFHAGIDCSGYMRACGGRGLLEGIARVVGELAVFLESAGPVCVGYDAWARAVLNVSESATLIRSGPEWVHDAFNLQTSMANTTSPPLYQAMANLRQLAPGGIKSAGERGGNDGRYPASTDFLQQSEISLWQLLPPPTLPLPETYCLAAATSTPTTAKTEGIYHDCDRLVLANGGFCQPGSIVSGTHYNSCTMAEAAALSAHSFGGVSGEYGSPAGSPADRPGTGCPVQVACHAEHVPNSGQYPGSQAACNLKCRDSGPECGYRKAIEEDYSHCEAVQAKAGNKKQRGECRTSREFYGSVWVGYVNDVVKKVRSSSNSSSIREAVNPRMQRKRKAFSLAE